MYVHSLDILNWNFHFYLFILFFRPSPPEKSGGKGKAGKKGGKMSKEKMAMGASGQTK